MRPLFVVLFWSFLSCAVESNAFSQVGTCTSYWKSWSARPGDEGAFPDSNVSYFRYTFDLPRERRILLRITADFPIGRYMGFNIYNTSDMDSVAGIRDVEITPDVGTQNPYRTGEHASAGRYTLLMDPHDPAISQTQPSMIDDTTNALNRDPSSDEDKRKYQREIWYRIYDPVDGQGGSGLTQLPTVEAVDKETGLAVECPMHVDIPVPKGELDLGRLWSAPPGPEENGDLRFVHHEGMGLYANRDTDYLAARLKLRGGDKEVVVLKFRSPRVAKSIEDLRIPSKVDVRYWSFCIGGAVTTITTECLVDKNAKIDSDGFVRIVIGPESLRQNVADSNFMRRPIGMLPVLIYRNLIASPDFAGDFAKIPLWRSRLTTSDTGSNSYAADRFIGDYAPVGKVCSTDDYLKGACEI